MTYRMQFQGTSHINLSTAHYDTNSINSDKMINLKARNSLKNITQ